MLTPPAIYSIAGIIGLIIICLTALPIILDRTGDQEAKERRAAERAERKAEKARRRAEKHGHEDAEDIKPLKGVEHLRCTNCAHVFTVQTPKSTKKWTREVAFSCPECGQKGVLPPRNATPVEAVVPGGETVQRRYQCDHCREEWAVGVIGHRLKKDPQFEACPSCGESGHVQAVA